MKKQIKSFEDACKVLNLNASEVLPIVSSFPEKHQKSLIANAKLTLIAEALNDGWKPDYSNWNEYKYYPWFDFTPGSGWSSGACNDSYTVTYVGPRLVFKTRELAEYAGKQFIDLYNDLFNL